MESLLDENYKEQPWYVEIQKQLDHRKSGINVELAEIVEQNNDLTSKCSYYQDRNAELENQVAELKRQVYTLNESVQAMQKNARDYTEKSKRLNELEEQVNTLKEQETKMYKTQASNAQRLLTLSDKLSEKDQEIERKEESILRLTEQVRLLNIKRDDLLMLVKEKEKTIELLQDEYSAVKLELDKKDETMKRVEEENRVLVERWLRKVNEEATKVNSANQMYESMMEKAKKQAEAGTSAISNFTSLLSGAFASPISQAAHREASSSSLKGLQNLPAQDPANKPRAGLKPSSLPTEPLFYVSAHESEVNHVAVSYDGKLYATGGSDKKIKIFESGTGNLKFSLSGFLQSVMHVQFSFTDDSILACSNDHSVKVWNVETGRPKYTLTGHIGNVWSARFSNDSTKIVSGSHDRTIKVWDIQKGSCARTLFTYSSVNDLCMTDDFGIVSGHVDSSVRFWDINSGDCIRELSGIHAGQVTSVSLCPDTYHILTCSRDNTLKIMDIRTYAILKTFTTESFHVPYNFSRACFSSDGVYVAAGSQNGNIFIWNAKDCKLERVLTKHKHPVTAVTWSPSGGSFLYSVDKDRHVCSWK